MIWSVGVICLLFTTVRSNKTSTVLPLPSDKLTCEYLQQPLCRNTGYNQTAFPNTREHETQDEASSEMADFSRLWTGNIPCSNAIVHLLCSFYFPFCGPQGEQGKNITLQPCRNLCEVARSGCEDIIEEATELGWPTFLDCNKFPAREDADPPCFGPPDPSVLAIPDGELNTTTPTPTPTLQSTAHSQILPPSLTLTSTFILISIL